MLSGLLPLSALQTLYAAQAMVAAGLGTALLILARAERLHIKAWGWALVALGVHHMFALAAAEASRSAIPLWQKTGISGISVAAGYLFALWFGAGVLRALDRPPASRWLRRLSWAAVIMGVALAIPFAGAPYPSTARIALRVGLRAGVTACILLLCARWIVQDIRSRRRGPAAWALGSIVLITGLLHLDYALASFYGVGLATLASGTTLPLLHLVILAALGMACIGWLADEERHRGDRATAALEREKERALFMYQHMLDAIVEIQVDGTLLHVSPRAEVIAGASSEELVGSNFMDRIHPEDRGAAASALRGTTGTGRTTELRFRHGDGDWRWLETVGSPIEGSGGDRFVITARDITDRKELNDRLTRSQKLEITGRLVGAIAHDFNNVLTVVQAHSELLLDELASGDPWRREIEDIMDATERASRLIRRLLAFTRRGPSHRAELDVNYALSDLETFLGRIMGDAVTVRMSLAPDAPAVIADPSEMESVLLNLAVNAREAMPGGGTLDISTSRVDRKPADGLTSDSVPHLHLQVRDSGAGIPAEVQGRVFEPFFTTKESTGTGLGLATVLGVVRDGGGRIDLSSRVGEGTTFDIYLPAAGPTV